MSLEDAFTRKLCLMRHLSIMAARQQGSNLSAIFHTQSLEQFVCGENVIQPHGYEQMPTLTLLHIYSPEQHFLSVFTFLLLPQTYQTNTQSEHSHIVMHFGLLGFVCVKKKQGENSSTDWDQRNLNIGVKTPQRPQ